MTSRSPHSAQTGAGDTGRGLRHRGELEVGTRVTHLIRPKTHIGDGFVGIEPNVGSGPRG